MIVVILPAFNENESLPILVQRIRELTGKQSLGDLKIIVVDDGSTDKTAESIQDIIGNDLILVRHSINKGLGEAIKTGMVKALSLSPLPNVIVTMDADNTHEPGLLTGMEMAINDGNDVVIASRYRPGSHVVGLSQGRLILSQGMSWIFRLLLPIRGVRDYSCGYRAYRPELIQKAFATWGDQFISQSGFTCMIEILLKLHRLNAVFCEVPLILRYDMKQGKSKMNVIKTIRGTIQILLKERFNISE